MKIFLHVWLAFALMLTIFHHPKAKSVCLASFLARGLPPLKSPFFLCKKARQTKGFCRWIMKSCQHQHKGKPHKQEKPQDAATSVEDAITDIVHTNGVGT
jgi:hypothetical protein